MVFGGDHLLTAVHLQQKGFKPIGVLRSHYQIQLRHPPEQGFALLLSNAARHHQGEIGVAAFPLGLSAEVAVNLLLGVVPDGAGVVEHQIGIQFG